MKRINLYPLIAVGLLLLSTASLSAQNLTQPPSGDNQKASVTQYMGLVSVRIDYSSPDVHGANGEDRRGKIWGQLVPYGLNDEGFGWSSPENPIPWRAGANENTVVTVSHDVQVEGQSLKAGSYGLHMITGPGEWAVIFSKNTSSWGSYFYTKSEEALRVAVQPVKSDYHEWLTYEFTDRLPASTTAWLRWEELSVPIRFSVPNIEQLYVQQMREDLRSSAGFDHQNWVAAINYCVANKVNLEEALTWADFAINGAFVGQRNFATLQAKSSVLAALGKTAEAAALMKEAVKEPTAGVTQVHFYARQLLQEGKKQDALEIFKMNADRHPGDFTAMVGLARGYSATGDYKKALEWVQKALPLAPNEVNRKSLEGAVETLKAGKDFN